MPRGNPTRALDHTARVVLIAPFAEEVARYEPADSSLALKGAVAVAVRSSLLEEAHAHWPVERSNTHRDLQAIIAIRHHARKLDVG